jgi:hypothetical protein
LVSDLLRRTNEIKTFCLGSVAKMDRFDKEKVLMPDSQFRQLPITDLERIARFRTAGYGGSVSDALNTLGVRDTVFSNEFNPLRQGMQLVGRALPIKLHSQVEVARTDEEQQALKAKWEAGVGTRRNA